MKQFSLLLLSGVLLWASACQEADTLAVDEDEFAQDWYEIFHTDSISFYTSTVMLDSQPTDQSGRLLAGQYLDEQIGASKVWSYFQLTASTSELSNLTEGTWYFDSLTFSLMATYAWGDTVQPQSLGIYTLSEAISEETHYTPDSAALGTQIGEVYGRPKLGNLRSMRLDDAFGQALFAAIVQKEVTDNEEFTDYLPGLALVPTDANRAIIGFADTSAVMQLHCHRSWQERETAQLSFSLSSDGTYYYRLAANRDGSFLEGLQPGDSVSSAQTGNTTFLQAAGGLALRVDFPTLHTLQDDGGVVVQKAVLRLPVVAPTSSVPSATLACYLASATNKIRGTVTTDSGVLQAYLRQEENSGRYYYELSLTGYLDEVLKSPAPVPSLLLAYTPGSVVSQLDQVTLAGPGYGTRPAELGLYYILIQRD
ncbi:protein of unknown function [Catalinimonas alkaloidigena]|uniref:Lipoprotein n=1 Tax=Catalinimonas alkaloidigena TaxID=1075417 RepID=A0A1G9GLW8_9BACT|nr:DUF4270 family protein [Catalinimonas alkaloidigena]SDL01657.1 protein of unknown function [Catalinimonas alkaloidigena]